MTSLKFVHLKFNFLKSKTSRLLLQILWESKQLINETSKKLNIEQTLPFGESLAFACFYVLTPKVTFSSLEKTILILKPDAFELGALSWKAS